MIKSLRRQPEDGDGEGAELKPFLEHLEDLRLMLVRCIASLAIGVAVSFPLIPRILALLKKPLEAVSAEHNQNLLRSGNSVASGFTAAMQVGVWSGLVLSSPAIFYFISRFVAPALTDRERGVIRQTLGLGFVLFLFGVWLAWQMAMPVAIKTMVWFNDWMGVETWWTLGDYVQFTTIMLLAFGLVFEVPVLLLVLGRLGIIGSAWLRKYRRHAIVVGLVVAAAITPSPDIASQLIVAVPLVFLYEACVWIIYFTEKKRAAASAGTGSA